MLELIFERKNGYKYFIPVNILFFKTTVVRA